jgi:hypothetical protein
MTCELVTLIGPAEAVAVSASKAAPETIEILFVSITYLLWVCEKPHLRAWKRLLADSFRFKAEHRRRADDDQ